jgi:hydrogenase maturation protease
MTAREQIAILGVGNLLLTDDGVGVHVVEELRAKYEFPDNVLVVDGGTVGLTLVDLISKTDQLIVVDAVKNGGEPGILYRLEGGSLPHRVLAKNSLHQIDLLEVLTLCQTLDSVPETCIIGVEPMDVESMNIELTPPVQAKVEPMVGMVLGELRRLGVRYTVRVE